MLNLYAYEKREQKFPCSNYVLKYIFIKYTTEAISMSDRIVVLSNRPAKIKHIYKIDLTNKTTPIQNRKCIEFNSYYDKIWRDLDA